MEKPQSLVLFDGHALLFRAYYAFPPLTSPDGQLVNAVYGFTSTLLSVLSELSPEYCLVAFDVDSDTIRRQNYAEYKAQRQPTPPELIAQIPLTKDVVAALGIPIFEQQGYEADDMLGTLAHLASHDQVKAVVVTADKDAFQLVNDPYVAVFVPGRKQIPSLLYGETEVYEKMGVRVDQIVDFKALSGDSSDNIPGVKGIGPKTAVGLLKEYGTLEALYQALDEGEHQLPAGVVKKLTSDRDKAFLSQELARIITDLPLAFDLEQARVSGYDKPEAVALFSRLGFKSLINRLPEDAFEKGVQEALL